MNSAKREQICHINAKKNYSVIGTFSKNIYVSDKFSGKFMAIFGKSHNNFHFKKLEPKSFLADDFALFLDPTKSIFKYDIVEQNSFSSSHK